VSRLLDVPAPTIRSWERRYHLPQASRTASGHRRYSQAQVHALRRMRDAIARGQRPGEAASQAQTAQTRAEAARPLIDTLLQAAHQLNPRTMTKVLDHAHATLGLGATVDDVLLPVMRRLGSDWQTGRCDIAHEHLTTETIRTWLTTTAPDRPNHPHSRQPIILTCGPDDHHTLGLESLAALLRQQHWDCRLLGAAVPTDSLSVAITQIKPAAVVLVSHLPAGRRAAVQALTAATQTLQAADLPNSHVFYAGNAFLTGRTREGIPGSYLGDDLTHAADHITTTASTLTVNRGGTELPITE
jgi:DNA-binding transcriptional MerR regulator